MPRLAGATRAVLLGAARAGPLGLPVGALGIWDFAQISGTTVKNLVAPGSGDLIMASAPTVTNGVADLSGGKTGQIALPAAVSIGDCTVIAVTRRKAAGANASFQPWFSKKEDYTAWAAGLNHVSTPAPSIVYASTYPGLLQRSTNLFSPIGSALRVFTHVMIGTTFKSYINGVEILTNTGTTVTPQSVQNLYFNTLQSAAFYQGAEYAVCAIYLRALSPAEVLAASNRLLAYATANGYSLAPFRVVMVVGNSIAYGQAGNVGVGGYPERMAPNMATQVNGGNLGVASTNYTYLTSIRAQVVGIINAVKAAGGKIVICCHGGENEPAQVSTDPSVVAAGYATEHAAWRAAGARTVQSTICERGDNLGGISTATFNTFRAAFNTAVRNAVGTSWDACADIASDSVMGIDGASANATYFAADKVHYADAGHAKVEPLGRAAADAAMALA